MTNDEIEELVGLKDMDRNFLRVRENGLLLTDNQVTTLERHNINPAKCTTVSELLYLIDEYGDDDDELNNLADQLSERNYYQNTRK